MTARNTIRLAGWAALGSLTVSLAGAAPAAAETAVVLLDGKSLAMVDTAKRKVTGTVKVDGGASLVGIDVRPADGKLYGLTPSGTIVTIDPKTGKWEKASELSEKLPAGASVVVDFNPVADRLRVMASDGTNLRVNVADGKAIVDGRLKYAETDAAKGTTPKVTAAAYTDSVAGTRTTALYDIEALKAALVKQAPPNDGVLVTVGPLGMKLGSSIAFDILADGKGGNAAWLLSDGVMHQVDLATGKARSVGAIEGLKGKVVDLAILPPA